MALTASEPTRRDITNNDGVHHHKARHVSAEMYLQAKDEGFEIDALCGARKVPHPNPLELPCCEFCGMLLDNECIGANL